MTTTDPFIVSASGVRGVVGSTMTPAVAVRYGEAFGQYLRTTGLADDPEAYVIVGRDSRTSGELLSDAASAGLRAAGIPVRDAGIATTWSDHRPPHLAHELQALHARHAADLDGDGAVGVTDLIALITAWGGCG